MISNGKMTADPRFEIPHAERQQSFSWWSALNFATSAATLIAVYWLAFHVVPDLRNMRSADIKHTTRIEEAQKTQVKDAAYLLLLNQQNIDAANELHKTLKGESK